MERREDWSLLRLDFFADLILLPLGNVDLAEGLLQLGESIVREFFALRLKVADIF